MSHHMRPTEASFAADLRTERPALVPPFTDALPGARAAVMARLWRALLFEQGLAAALPEEVRTRLRGPALLPHDVGAVKDELVVHLGDREYTHPAALLADLGLPGSAELTAELDHSVASLALSRAATAHRSPVPDTLVGQEQSVVDGHPYHPCCRSRPGFTVADQLAYAPEHRRPVELALLAVPAAEALLVGDWPQWLREGDRVLLPVHPWQLREVLPRLGPPGLTGGIAGGINGWIAGGITASALMSVRTLAPGGGGPHLKTSLSLRMTSAVRDISGESVVNSAPLSALLAELSERLGGELVVTRNLAAGAALVGGVPSRDVAVLVRESPELHAGPGERVVPLAALAEHPPQLADPVGWLRSLAAVVWPPLLRLLSWGVALEAHGQNLLVVLDRLQRPLRLVYRDLADVRVSRERLAACGIRPTSLGGHVLDDDPVVLRRKLYGSVLGGSFGSLVSGLGRRDRLLEGLLWEAVAQEAGTAAEVLSPEDRRALLRDPLPVKALTRMRLAGGPPGDQWTLLPNPLADGGRGGTASAAPLDANGIRGVPTAGTHGW